jgi:hypothetical protein
MPQLWRLYMYKRHRNGATVDELQLETGIPAEQIAIQLEAAKLCFEKQCQFIALPRDPAILNR